MPPNLKKTKQQPTPRPHTHRGVLVLLASLILFGGVVIGFVFLFSAHYQGVVYPGVQLGQTDISRVSYDTCGAGKSRR